MQKWSRGQVEARLANMPPCLIGMEACVGAYHLSRLPRHRYLSCLAPATKNPARVDIEYNERCKSNMEDHLWPRCE
jgi:hypothetical protein